MRIILISSVIILLIAASSYWLGINYPSVNLFTKETHEANSTEKIDGANELADKILTPIEMAKEAKEMIEAESGTTLNLSNKGLTKVSAAIFSQIELTTLNLSHNLLSGSLPAEVRQLKNLKTLDLSHNNFTGVPAEIGQLTELEVLNLSFNQLTGLPYELGNLSKLQTLDLRGNEYSKADLVVIKEKLPNATVVLTDN